MVVFFTTSRDELERRFEGLKRTLDPADGLWIAWPKKAARIEGDLSFEAVQEVGLAHSLVDNKSCSIDQRGRLVSVQENPPDDPSRVMIRNILLGLVIDGVGDDAARLLLAFAITAPLDERISELVCR